MFCERCGTEIKNPEKKFCNVCGSALNHRQQAYTDPHMYETVTSRRQYAAGSSTENKAQTAYPGYPPPSQPPLQRRPPQPQRRPPSQYAQPGNAPFSPAAKKGVSGARTAQGTAKEAVDPRKKDRILLLEFLCSLFGIFGIGWIASKETTVGVLLLLGSIFGVWPLTMLSLVLTYGFSLICIAPAAIAAIITNILLLNYQLTHPNRRRYTWKR